MKKYLTSTLLLLVFITMQEKAYSQTEDMRLIDVIDATSLSSDGVSTVFLQDSLLAIGKVDGTVELWNYNQLKNIKTFKAHRNTVNAICISASLHYMGTSNGEGVKLWNLDSGEEIYSFKRENNESPVTNIYFEKDNSEIVIIDKNNTITIWNLNGLTRMDD